MKKHKIDLRPLLSRTRVLRAKLIIILLALTVLGLVAASGLRYLMRSDYFRIRDVLVAEGIKDNFSYLKGRNIFSIDLNKESQYISNLYPIYKKIQLIRLLPDRIYINFAKRQALAYVRLYRDFCVDKDLMLFDPVDNMGRENLPIIVGLETKIHGPKSGRKYAIKELVLALNLIKQINNNKALKNYNFKIIDVRKPDIVLLILENGPEIRMSQSNTENRVNLLATLFIQSKGALNNIKYIDLRFKDPVIKLKDTK